MSNSNLWTVFVNTPDYPGKYCARRFVRTRATKDVFVSRDLEKIRVWILENAKVHGSPDIQMKERLPKDSKLIQETWL